MSFTRDEVDFLAANADAINQVTGQLEMSSASLMRDHGVVDKHFPGYARAVLELAGARLSARGKFPETWLADSDAAQQATPAAVAALRAQHLAEAGVRLVHDVTCSVGTEAHAASAAGLAWLGSDLDEVRLRMARHNLGPAAWLARADALRPIVSLGSDTVIVADPARRRGGRRITDPEQLMPPLSDVLHAHRGHELAVKCAPGIDYSAWEGLVSVVSLDGGVKEACLYTPGLGAAHTREAVVLADGGVKETLTDGEPDEVDVTGAREFIVEPDGAIIRAGLVRHWGNRHGLSMLDPHIAYLTGASIPAGYSGFRVAEEVPLKKLRLALKARRVGSAEILVRGVDVDPDRLRRQLKLHGPERAGVVIARVKDSARAFICGPREWGGSSRGG